MPSNEVQIALANLDLLARGEVLTMGFGADLARPLADHPGCTRLSVFNTDFRLHRGCQGIDAHFAPWLRSGAPFDSVVIAMPKATERLRMLLPMARSVMEPGARLALVGRNDAGIRSAARRVGEAIGEAATMDYRFHCRVIEATATGPLAAFRPEDWRAQWSTDVGGPKIDVVSYPGMFSHGELDAGTAMLLEVLPTPRVASRALDVGCGSGVIAARLIERGAEVDAIDTDALALRAASETAPGAHVFASDVFSDAPGPYDVIVSNPPFHAGVRTTTGVAERLIAEAPAHLSRAGELWIVANRFLDYGTSLRAAFTHVHIEREDNHFRVWRGTN